MDKKSTEEAYLDSCAGMEPKDIIGVIQQQVRRCCARFAEDTETGGTRASFISGDESEGEVFTAIISAAPKESERINLEALEKHRKEFSRLARIAKLLGERVAGTPEGDTDFYSDLGKLVNEIFQNLLQIVTAIKVEELRREPLDGEVLGVKAGHFSCSPSLGLDMTKAQSENPYFILKMFSHLLTTDKLVYTEDLSSCSCIHPEYKENGCMDVVRAINRHDSPAEMDKWEEDLAIVCPFLRPYVKGMNAFVAKLVEEEINSIPPDDPFTFLLTTRPAWRALEYAEQVKCGLGCNVGFMINPAAISLGRMISEVTREMLDVMSSMVTSKVGRTAYLDDMPSYLRYRALVEGIAELASFAVIYETARRCYILSDEIISRYEHVLSAVLEVQSEWEDTIVNHVEAGDTEIPAEEVGHLKDMLQRLKESGLATLEHSGLFRFDGPQSAETALKAVREALDIIYEEEEKYDNEYIFTEEEEEAEAGG